MTVSHGKARLMQSLQPHQEQRADEQRPRRRTSTARRSGRSRSAACAAGPRCRRGRRPAVLTTPSTPRLSKYTGSRVSHWPGRMSTASLNASAYRSRRAATVTGETPAGATARDRRRPYMSQAQRRRRPATSTSVTMPEHPVVDARARVGWRDPVDRASQCDEPPLMIEQRARRPTEPTRQHDHRDGHRPAATRAGARPSSQRFSPKNVISMRPGHVERGDAGAEQGDAPEDPARRAALVERRLDDLVLGAEAGERREADDREVAAGEGDEGDRHDLAQPAEAAHVHLVVHAVHDRAGAEEQAGLEEAVGEQVHDAERVAGRAEPDGQDHVADLAHGRVGQHLLDVVLGAADDRAEEQRDRADDRDHEPRGGATVEDRRWTGRSGRRRR